MKGVLHGEARVISIDNSNLGGSWRELRYFKIGVYDNGKPVGDQVMIAGAADSRVIYVNQILEQNRARIDEIDAIDGVDRVPQAVSPTTSKVEQRHQGSWPVPQVGFYSWLQPPANGSLKNANAAAYLPRLKAELSDDVAAQLRPGAKQTCELDADTQSYLLFQLSAAEQASKRATQQGVGQGHRDGPVD